MLQEYVLKYLHDLKKLKENKGVIKNLKCGLTNPLRSQKSSSMVMANDIVYALVTFNKIINNRQVAQILGVDRRNIKRALERQHTLDNNEDGFWLQKRQENMLMLYVKLQSNRLFAFWTSKTTISPNSKDVTQRRIGRKQYDVHATHYLQVFQVYSYT